ncbi:MAG: inner membrane protein YrbG [Bacteroidota bacterium]|jgi:cation:H+ antiporter
MDYLFLVVGLLVLVAGGDWLLKSAVALSLRLRVPKIVIGLTVVSFATSAPELIVSVKSALDGFPDLAVANVVGSNIANLGLILGITLMLGSIEVTRSFYKTDWPVMMFASLLLFGTSVFDGQISSLEGWMFFGLLGLFVWYIVKFQKTAVVDELPEDDLPLSLSKTWGYLLIGGLALWGGSELLVQSAVSIATALGVSDRIIGITVVSVGTSIPELAASVIAVLKKEKAISLGNLLGSNIFNVFAVLGITAIISPIQIVDRGLVDQDMIWMLAFALVVLPLVFLPKGLRLNWRDGLVLLGMYGVFLYQTLG